MVPDQYVNMRGMSSLVASVMLVLIAVVASVFVSSWLTTTTEKETNVVRNSTREQIQCQYADLYIRDAAFNCGGDCSAGVVHNITLSVVNSGKRTLYVDRIYATNTTGSVVEFTLNKTTELLVGDVVPLINTTAASCSGMNRTLEYVRIAPMNCPNAYDSLEGSRITYVNC